MADKNSFLLYKDSYAEIQLLSIEQRGLLITAIFEYVITGKALETSDTALMIVFSTLKRFIDRDAEKYEEKCNKNRDNGKQGGRPPKKQKDSDKSERFSAKPKKADNDNDNVNENENDNDIDNTLSPNGDVSFSTDYQSIVDIFNSTCLSLPKVQKLTDKRRKKLKALLKTYGTEDITTVFTKAESSDFLKGNVNSFQASFDWLIEVSNFVKVHEGNYDNRKAQQDADKYFDHSLDDLFH